MKNAMRALAVYENGILRPTTMLMGLTEGQEVEITVRPVITDPEELRRIGEEVLRQMEEAGEVSHFPPPAEPPPKDWKPLVIEGEPLSQTIIRMRGEG